MDRTTETLARYATSLRYADLSASTVQAATGHLLDSLGCAIGGYGSEPAAIARRLAPAWRGAPSARLLREGRTTAPEAAAFAGCLLGLSAARVADAIAIAVTASVATRQTRAGELAMWKGCATATAAKAGLFAAQLAREGMTGPTAAFEGRHGLGEQVTGPFEIGALGGGGRPFAIERTNFKFFAAEYHAQAPLAMALTLRGKVRVEEIDAIDVQIYAMAYSEIGSEPAKWDPRTRETADHSLPYMLAVALRDGHITPASFEPQRYLDASLRPLMNRIRVAESPEFTRRFPQGLGSQIDVVTRSGQRFTTRADYPKGHARNPMTDNDIETKFRDLSLDVLGAEQVNVALQALWHLDEAPRTSAVLDALTLSPDAKRP